MHVDTKHMEKYSINISYYQTVQSGLVNLDLPSPTDPPKHPPAEKRTTQKEKERKENKILKEKEKRDSFGIIIDLGDFCVYLSTC